MRFLLFIDTCMFLLCDEEKGSDQDMERLYIFWGGVKVGRECGVGGMVVFWRISLSLLSGWYLLGIYLFSRSL